MSRPLSVNQSSAGTRVPVEPDGVPHSRREHLESGPVRPHPQDRGIARVGPFADVARSPHRDVEQPVGSEPDEFPAVVFVLREGIVDDDRLGRGLQPRFDPVVPQDPVDLGDVERTPAKRHAVGARKFRAIVTTRWVPSAVSPGRTAYTSPRRVPTKSVPRSPSVIERALGTSAYGAIRKPGGSLMSPRRRSAEPPVAAESSTPNAATMQKAIAVGRIPFFRIFRPPSS